MIMFVDIVQISPEDNPALNDVIAEFDLIKFKGDNAIDTCIYMFVCCEIYHTLLDRNLVNFKKAFKMAAKHEQLAY